MKRIPRYTPIEITEVLKATEQYCEPGMVHKVKEENTFFLLYIKEGNIRLTSDSLSFELPTGHFILAKINKEITFTSLAPSTRVISILFHEKEHSLASITNRSFFADEDYVSLFRMLSDQIEEIAFLKKRKPSITYDKMIGEMFGLCCSLLYSYLQQLLLSLSEKVIREELPKIIMANKETFFVKNEAWNTEQNKVIKTESTTTYSNKLVNQIIDFMKTNLDKNYAIDEIAQEFFVGSANLKKIFKKETGSSIMHYFKNLKMQAAKTWVRENELSYTEIAQRLGFNSIHHFSAAFKKHTGYSPSKYYDSLQPGFSEKVNSVDVIINQPPWPM
ncbi:hypothetical protein IGI37_002238 [Enterococcus sp. AZ194]|uniref:helix-turn-helix domain-containing protein n=1 Tax=Enterococcus sp. AZ194 TaxID=2774629 RepID=UPI003F2366A3